MGKTGAQLRLVSFASRADSDSLRQALVELGYSLTLSNGDDWLRANQNEPAWPTVLLLSRGECPRDDVLRTLRTTKQAGVLAISTRDDDANWDREILRHCGDFLSWPCYGDELALRMWRVFGGAESPANSVGEVESLAEFVSFNMLGQSPALIEALKLIKLCARAEASVLIEGETGTGKELAARAIHYLSPRRDFPFISVNCGAIPDNLLENELFGHEKGAFTDARESQPGLVVQAEGGTLFLDEVDALSQKAQVALLRFVECQEYRPLGGKKTRKTDVRIVAATNASLDTGVEKGLFRADLLFRLKVLSMQLPPLRDRGGDIRLLAEHFIRQYSARYKQPIKSLHPETLEWMVRYPWPGNVRQLENLLHREFLLTEGPVIYASEIDMGARRRTNGAANNARFAPDIGFKEAKATSVAAFEKSYLSWLMAESQGNVSLAARRARKERSALRKLLQKHAIDKNVWSVSH